MKKITQQQEGIIFLFGICSFIWFMISLNNKNEFLPSLFAGLFLGAITTLCLGLLFAFMKATFKW